MPGQCARKLGSSTMDGGMEMQPTPPLARKRKWGSSEQRQWILLEELTCLRLGLGVTNRNRDEHSPGPS